MYKQYSRKKTRENWCPDDRNCAWYERLVGCDVSDCPVSTQCALNSVQSNRSQNMSRFEDLLRFLEQGYRSCIDTTGCSAGQLESIHAPSLFPGDGRPTGFHLAQTTNAHNFCSGSGRLEVSRGTYGGPGTEIDSSIRAGHVPLSLSEQCYLLHDIMYNMILPGNTDGIVHCDMVLLHNLNYVRTVLGESSENQRSAQTGFCISTRDGGTGSGWSYAGLSTIAPSIIDFSGSVGGDWNGRGRLSNESHFIDRMKVVKALKTAKQNGVAVIDNFGFLEELEVGGEMTLWRSNPNFYRYYGQYSDPYFAYQIINNYRKQESLNLMYDYLTNMRESTTGKWGNFVVNCD